MTRTPLIAALLLVLPSFAQAQDAPELEPLCDVAAETIEANAGDCNGIAAAIDALIDEHEETLREHLPTLDLGGKTARHCQRAVNAVVRDPETRAVRPEHLVCLATPDIRAVIARLRGMREPEEP